MRILLLHNHYRVWGGESAAAGREAACLRAAGADVLQEEAHNDAIDAMGAWERALLPLRNAWSRASYLRMRSLCRSFRPDVVHVHNVWPLLSPAVFAAARAESVPAVFTAHNFYLFCLNGVFFRDGRICTDCFGGLPWPGVLHRCYRGVGGSLTRFAGLALHRALRTFRRVERILTPTEFARERFLAAGFDPARVLSKWLSCEDPRRPAAPDRLPPPCAPGDTAFLVACRLVPEKGVHVLVEAAARSAVPWRLLVAGEGPERAGLERRVEALGLRSRIAFLGHVPPPDLAARMDASAAVLIPSIWYETFGLTAIEAFAAGRPVVASDLGALREVVDERSGIRVPPGDAAAWASALDGLAADPGQSGRLGSGARARYDEHFTPERDARRLLAIYQQVLREHSITPPTDPPDAGTAPRRNRHASDISSGGIPPAGIPENTGAACRRPTPP